MLRQKTYTKTILGITFKKPIRSLVFLFEKSLKKESTIARESALSLAALCVGGMVLSRTLPNSELAEEIRCAAQKTAMHMAAF